MWFRHHSASTVCSQVVVSAKLIICVVWEKYFNKALLNMSYLMVLCNPQVRSALKRGKSTNIWTSWAWLGPLTMISVAPTWPLEQIQPCIASSRLWMLLPQLPWGQLPPPNSYEWFLKEPETLVGYELGWCWLSHCQLLESTAAKDFLSRHF